MTKFSKEQINQLRKKDLYTVLLSYDPNGWKESGDNRIISTKHDSLNILDIESPENIIKKIWDMGIQSVILKSIDRKGYYTGYNGNIFFTEFYTNDYIDTTCSGDAFNGGFLHAITHGFTYAEAVRFAAIVAGLQAKNIGAIKSIPYKDDVYSIYRSNNG